MKSIKLALISLVLSFVYACSHPIEIVGKGDVSSNTFRFCMLGGDEPGETNCSKNTVIGTYQVTYEALAHTDWQFDHWGNYCADAEDNTCSFNVPATSVRKHWGQTVPPLQAVFTPISDTSHADPFAHCTPTKATIAENVFGVHVWGPYQTHPKTLNALDDLGVDWVYNAFYWPTLEAEKDVYGIRHYDAFFLEMAQRGISPLMNVGNYWPTWINDADELKTELYQLVQILAARYKPGGAFAQEHNLGNFGVQYWEVINEPNYPCCGWGSHGANEPVDTALYVELLSVVHKALREEDENAVILHGGLSSSNEFLSPTTFLDEIYSYGAGDCFDVVAYHPYGDHWNFAGAVERVRNVMAEHGDVDKPVWFSELGEPLLQPTGDGQDTQIEVFEDAISQINEAQAFFWLGLHDFGEAETWGLLDNNLEPREPIYSAVKRYVKER
jgi:hypothetical protein